MKCRVLLYIVFLLAQIELVSGFSSFATRRWIQIRKVERDIVTTYSEGQNPTARTTTKLLALPACPPNDTFPLILRSGFFGIFCQLVFTKVLQKADFVKGKDGSLASYTAHNIVAMGLMLLVSCLGIIGWSSLPSCPFDRLITPNASARWLASVVAGMFIFWDVPTSIYVPQLRKPDVLIHHVAMALVALVGAIWIPMEYIFFYFGVSEISSVPLLLYDQLSVMNEDSLVADSKILAFFQAFAAIAFTCVRAVWFTRVTLLYFLPDVRSVLRGTSQISSTTANGLRFGGTMSLAFTLLQLFWFSKILRVVVGKDEEA